ncbi:unnamed protein product, partial [Ectocarpus fasciculatus]
PAVPSFFLASPLDNILLSHEPTPKVFVLIQKCSKQSGSNMCQGSGLTSCMCVSPRRASICLRREAAFPLSSCLAAFQPPPPTRVHLPPRKNDWPSVIGPAGAMPCPLEDGGPMV